MFRPLIAAFALVAAVATPALGADARTFDVPKELAKTVLAVKKHTSVPVLLPDTLTAGVDRLYPSGSGYRKGWSVGLDGARGCGSATACFISGFIAERGGTLPSGTRVKLRGGVTGVFRAMSCGASCAPANIWFRRKGVLYQFQFKPDGRQRPTMVALANQALKAGPR